MQQNSLLILIIALYFISSCRTMRSSAEEPVGAELSRSAPTSDLEKNSDEKEVELKRQACEDLEESQAPEDAERAVEIGVGKVLSGAGSKPYVGYRCNPK